MKLKIRKILLLGILLIGTITAFTLNINRISAINTGTNINPQGIREWGWTDR